MAAINSKLIHSAKSCEKINLIKRILKVNCNLDSLQGSIEKYDDYFGKIDSLLSAHHILVNKDIKPVIHPPQTIPFALNAK